MTINKIDPKFFRKVQMNSELTQRTKNGANCGECGACDLLTHLVTITDYRSGEIVEQYEESECEYGCNFGQVGKS